MLYTFISFSALFVVHSSSCISLPHWYISRERKKGREVEGWETGRKNLKSLSSFLSWSIYIFLSHIYKFILYFKISFFHLSPIFWMINLLSGPTFSLISLFRSLSHVNHFWSLLSPYHHISFLPDSTSFILTWVFQ